MPQIEEVQFVHWGSLRPDIVPLAAPGVTIAIGPNGAGKTCWLDGLKLILGVSDLSGKRTPGSYVFDGGPSGIPAERAFLRATFANPVVSGTKHRIFAVAGGGCEHAEHVTVICRVVGDTRSYLVVPRRVAWGLERPLDVDLEQLESQTPASRWRGPQKYDELLNRAGVNKALRAVLALPQGETDQLTKETPAGLIRRLLDLTGRQATLDEFRQARKVYETAHAAHENAQKKYELEQANLKLLERLVRQHRDWDSTRRELARLDEVLLPAARHYRCQEDIEAFKERITALETANNERAQLVATLETQRERRREEQAERIKTAARLEGDLADKEREQSAVDNLCGELHERARQARRRLVAATATAGAATLSDVQASVAVSEEALGATLATKAVLGEQLGAVTKEAAHVSAGGSLAPAPVREFHRQLADNDVTAEIVADVLVAKSTAAAELARAALGNAAFAIVVAPHLYSRACELASATGYQWPIVQAGPGDPSGVLAALTGPAHVGGLLAHLDATAADDVEGALRLVADGLPAVTADGMRYGPVLSQRHDHERALFELTARDMATAGLNEQSQHLRQRAAGLDRQLTELRAELTARYLVRHALAQLEQLRREFKQACRELAQAWTDRHTTHEQHRLLKIRERETALAIEGAYGDLRQRDEQLATLNADIGKGKADIEAARRERVDAEVRLAENQLPPGYSDEDLVSLDPVEHLEQRRQQLSDDLSNLVRYPEDVRDPVIVTQHANEDERLAEVGVLLEGKREELERHQYLVEEARQRYDHHVRAVVRLLDLEFRKVCVSAGSVGEIALTPGDQLHEFGVDILVAHKAGDKPLSYRNDHHSGGQRTKIAVLLLLAAMGLGGAADLLVVDEPHAHLDATNRSQIAELMRGLADRVQFVLASPTDGKDSDQPEWCDLQLAFLPRLAHEPYSPALRVLSRLDAEHLEARFVASQPPLM